ncbi:hypothetical protein P2H44_24515 [Albimonas sp. CAU 1670]|uniref:hypothetical protein n=1 Tax=Albimonas sp. CAU 1670 TaxID=3032599 RepID=UPI0023D99F0E|nr:hypothetical protein [Albimonas sp. CAU 1670]MDF2235732.1 hypothetical protein [Albimonas sp. CAU 1670]
MAVFWRIWATASASLAITLLILVGLTLLQYRNVQRTLLSERVAVLAQNTAEPFVSAMAIGMPLASVRNAKALLERARQTDDAIISIQLLEPGGRILSHAGEEGADASNLATLADWSAGAVNRFEGGRFVSVTPIRGAAGGSPGAIVVSLDAADSVDRAWAMGAELAAAGVAFHVVGSLAIGLSLRRAFASEIAAFDAVEQDVELFERDIWRGEPSAPGEGGELHRVLTEAHASYRAAALRSLADGAAN